MARDVGKSVIGVVVGVVVAELIIKITEFFRDLAFAPPPGMDLSDPAVLRQHAASLPWLAFVVALFGWGIGTVVGAYVAASIGSESPVVRGSVVGGLMLIGAILTMIGFPHPIWVWIVALVLFPASGYLGAKLAWLPAAREG